MLRNERAGWVCMAVYRPDPQLLARQITSIRRQTLADWVCEIGIDGRDALAAQTIRSIVGDDDRFRITEFADNVGFYRNFERLLTRVPAEVAWVALADQDDHWYADKFRLLVPALETAALVTGQARVVDSSGRTAGEPTVRKSVGLVAEMIDNQVTGSLSLVRRSLLDQALPFPEPTDSAYHDHWLGVCATVDAGVTVSEHVVQDYVQHGANVIGEEGAPSLASRLRRLGAASQGGLSSRLTYLRTHRWGWRVTMARTVLERFGDVGADDERALSAIAAGRLSGPVTSAFTRAVVAREAPPLRAIGLLAGAAWRRR